MKKNYLVLSCLFALLLFSCQDETEKITLNSENSFSKTSPLSSLIKRVAQNETTIDNVLDNTSCFSVKLPVGLTVDSQYQYVSTASQYSDVEDIKNASGSDDDIVHFTFPITLVYPDFHEVVVATQYQYDAILAQCGNGNGFNEIACIDFNYPITINIYNINNQVASSITIESNGQLYNFINNLTSGEIVGIVFPLTLTKSGGMSVTVNSNSQLETQIDNVIDDCGGGSGPSPLLLADVLTNGSWHVSYCFDDHDETSYYAGYNFVFNPNGTSVVTKMSTTIQGDWDIHNEAGYQRLDLNFDGSALDEMEDNWKVLEFSATSIRLKELSGGGSENHYLNFTKN